MTDMGSECTLLAQHRTGENLGALTIDFEIREFTCIRVENEGERLISCTINVSGINNIMV
ncbi:hypothetical protein ES703_61889 [subsurface metagenome]